jgi:hypothetical protein
MREEFNAAYWAAKHPDVRALKDMETCSLDRMGEAFDLARAGHILDYEIDAVGQDAYQTMWLRLQHGITWTQRFPEPCPWNLAPGITGLPGIPFDPNHPPAGAIKTSIDAADYQPFDPPKPPPMIDGVAAEPWWERPLGPGKFAVRIGDSSPHGAVSGDYVKKIVPSPFGKPWMWWEQKG